MLKFVVVSDIHGSLYFTEKFFDIVDNLKYEKLVLLGDLYYHGVRNPLTNNYAPLDVAKMLNKRKEKIIAIKGNCDSEVDETVSEFPFVQHKKIKANNKIFFFTHGHVYNEEVLPKEDFDILMYGHYHTGFIKKKNNKIIVNPGSLSLPKENTENSFVLVDDQNISLYSLESNKIIQQIKYM